MREPEGRHHGGISARQLHALRLDPSDLVDFSVNINPFGPSARVRAAIRNAPLDRYPDPESWEAREALSHKCSVPIEELALGAGACELLFGLARVFHRPTSRALIVEPTFSEYAAAVRSVGAAVVSVRAQEEHDFAFPLEATLRAARRHEVASVYLCAPTSPLGQPVPENTLSTLAQELAPLPVIVDESFLSLSTSPAARAGKPGEISSPSAEEPPACWSVADNVVRVRSLTKDLGVPGLRVGYLIARADWVARLEDFRPRWSVSSAAQAAALAATHDDDFLSQSRAQIAELRPELSELLVRAGFFPRPSVTNYCAARAPVPVGSLCASLLQRGILVRDCTSFGLPHYARFAVRPRADLERLARALDAVLPNLVNSDGGRS